MFPIEKDRRKERRFIVSGMQGYVDDIPCAILDISASGVRLLIPDERLPEAETFRLVFEYEADGDIVREEVVGELVRQTDLFFVLSYIPPRDGWEETVRSMDFVDALTRFDLAL